jgi:hypothetical protein
VTLGIKTFSFIPLGISIKCHYAECHYIVCRALFIVMLIVIMLSVVMLSVVELQSVMLSVVAHFLLFSVTSIGQGNTNTLA